MCLFHKRVDVILLTGLAAIFLCLLMVGCDSNNRSEELDNHAEERLERTRANFAKIKPGMTLAEVEPLIGPGMSNPPYADIAPQVRVDDGRPQYVRYWNYIDTRPSPVVQGCSLTVSFYEDDNTVANLSHQPLFPE